jgi:hypothetical protein
MYLMAIAWLFGVPAYYLAKSKGRSGRAYAILTVLLGIPVSGLGAFGFVLPAASLVVVFLLPARPGAPGKAYLRIVFPCPECGETVSFPRHREGVAEFCPECGELIRVPEDEHSPKPTAHDRRKPTAARGEACFESFGRLEPAQQLAAILNGGGVNARVASDSGGGVLPHIGNTEGHRVMIDAAQWDEAVDIERQCQETQKSTSETASSAAFVGPDA